MVSLLTLWLAVQWIVLHDVNRWRPWVVQLLSQSVGTAVTVDRLAPGKFHLLPTLVLEGVTVQDPTGHPGLQVQRIQARVDPWDFLQGRLDFDRLVIDQPRLVLRRDSAGHLSLSGIPLPGPGAGPSPFFDWLIHQGEIRLNGESCFGAMSYDTLQICCCVKWNWICVMVQVVTACHWIWSLHAAYPAHCMLPLPCMVCYGGIGGTGKGMAKWMVRASTGLRWLPGSMEWRPLNGPQGLFT